MNEALLIPVLWGLAAGALVVILMVCRSIWREMGDGGADAQDGSATERRKNEKIRREVERWREGR
jgi:hypothetical protein